MNRPASCGIAALLLLGGLALPAAAAQRTFVASTGLDTNNCSITAPCRTFTRAMTQTDPNGEVLVLDSAGYGAFTISQSVSIIAPPGVYAGISVFTTSPSQTGISIAGPGIRVTLRGLTINGQGGDTGVSFTQGSRLVMEDCTVKGLSNTGIFIIEAVEATLANLRVEDNGSVGILVLNGANVSVSRSVLSGHSNSGILVQAAVAATPTRGVITDSVLSHNQGGGIVGFSSVVGAQVRVVAARNQVINGNFGIVGSASTCADASCAQVVATDNVVQDMASSGIVAFDGATVVASRNTVTNSNFGLNEPGTGTFISMGGNVSELNTNNTNGTITPGTLR